MKKHLVNILPVLQPLLADEQRPAVKQGKAKLLDTITVRTGVLEGTKQELE